MKTDAWNPQQYDKFKSERSQPFFDLMDLLAPTPNPEVIDLGCGTGELMAELHKRTGAKQTLGIDSSAEMLKKASLLHEKGLAFQTGDINSWAPAESFDIVFSNAALQWCPNHPELFRRLRNALRPGGQLAAQMPMNHDYPTHILANEMAHEEPWATLMGEKYEKQKTMLTVEDYAKLIFSLGFKEQKVLLKVYGHILESREGVIEWVKGTLLTHFQGRLRETDYQKFLGEFRQRLFSQLPDEKPFFYPFKRILIWARK